MHGSLLGINYKQIESISVGYKTDYDMYSMDFEEFFWAKGYDDSLRMDMLNSMIELKPFNSSINDTLRSLFIDYSILGGMPEVVARYFESNSFSGTLDLQRQIIIAYREDTGKISESMQRARIRQE